MSDVRIVLCGACGGEGRRLEVWPCEWNPVDMGPCEYCDGTGGEIRTVQPIDMADLDEINRDDVVGR